jgi:hypothetical protein
MIVVKPCRRANRRKRVLIMPRRNSVQRVPGRVSQVNASLGFRSFDGAQRTIQGYEAMVQEKNYPNLQLTEQALLLQALKGAR